ncbi:unnamed protein product [Toxocara canis]|uniref:Transposase n=1 Tax=Toxocara canis TaxID=6265 RepID=A0A183UZ64_TOXCA|nr:unnamed protein product [Toxocara canis]
MGIYAIMGSFPSKDPVRPTAVGANSIILTNNSLAKGLQRRFPQVFSPDLGHYNLAKASLQLNAGAKPIFYSKRPAQYVALAAVDKELDRLETDSLLSPTVRHEPVKNTRLERQFNRQCGARNQTVKLGDPVLVRTYQGEELTGQKGKC